MSHIFIYTGSSYEESDLKWKMENEKTISELLLCLFYAITFQRCIYPSHFYEKTHKWGIPIMVCTNKEVKVYFTNVIKSIRHEWLKSNSNAINEVSMYFESGSSGEVLEKWKFSFQTILFQKSEELTEELIRQNIRNIMRQIHSSVLFLPVLEGDIKVRISLEESITASLNTIVPDGWKRSQHAYVSAGVNGEFDDVRLNERLIIQPQVSYKVPY